AGPEPDRQRTSATSGRAGAAATLAGPGRQCTGAVRTAARRALGSDLRLPEPVAGVLAVQAGDRQGGAGLWRLQAAGDDRRLGGLAGAAVDAAVVFGARRADRAVPAAPAQGVDGLGHALWPLSGHCGLDRRALG